MLEHGLLFETYISGDTDTLRRQGHTQETRTGSGDTDTLRGHVHTQETGTRSGDTDTLRRPGQAQGTIKILQNF